MSNVKNHKKSFAQYYTPPSIADLVVKFSRGSIFNMLDLAAGEGELLKSALNKFSGRSIAAIDLDSRNAMALAHIFQDSLILNDNALDLNRTSLSLLDEGGFDFVVGNPPFNKQKISSFSKAVIREQLNLDLTRHASVRSEIAFLALSLHFARKNGAVSLILPKSVACGFTYRFVRKAMVFRHGLSHVIELPPYTFSETEAETCIFVLRKDHGARSCIRLMKADKLGEIEKDFFINSSETDGRVDFDYHEWRHSAPEFSENLESLGAKVWRGNIHNKKAISLGLSLFHTSDFYKVRGGVVNFSAAKKNHINNFHKSKKNDIVLPRVGRNLNSSALVGAGESIISDCILSIRVDKRHLSKVIDSINSDRCVDWLKAHRSGVCAKLITQNDILAMPIF